MLKPSPYHGSVRRKAFVKWLRREPETSSMGLWLYKRDRWGLSSPFLPCKEDTVNKVCRPGRVPSPDTESASTLILEFANTPKLWETDSGGLRGSCSVYCSINLFSPHLEKKLNVTRNKGGLHSSRSHGASRSLDSSRTVNCSTFSQEELQTLSGSPGPRNLLLIFLSLPIWFSNFLLSHLISALHLTCHAPCCNFSFLQVPIRRLNDKILFLFLDQHLKLTYTPKQCTFPHTCWIWMRMNLHVTCDNGKVGIETFFHMLTWEAIGHRAYTRVWPHRTSFKLN